MLEQLLDTIADATLLAPALAVLAGALLTVSPTAWPTIPVVVSAVSPRAVGPGGPSGVQLLRSVPSVLAFVAGMDGVLALFGAAIVEVSDFLTRAGLVLHLTAALLLGGLGLRLLLRRTSLCRRVGAIPPAPTEAFSFGLVFGVVGCPGCAPIAVGVGAAAGLAAGPAIALAVVAAFIAGRTAALVAIAAVGARLFPTSTEASHWRRIDLVIGWMFLVAAAYYFYRVVSGAVITSLPGEPGGGLA